MKTLFAALSQNEKEAVALLLGFKYTKETAVGFDLNLREIPAPKGDFTIGDACIEYVNHLSI